eukprot:759464-Hanusia_phi.AAC.1
MSGFVFSLKEEAEKLTRPLRSFCLHCSEKLDGRGGSRGGRGRNDRSGGQQEEEENEGGREEIIMLHGKSQPNSLTSQDGRQTHLTAASQPSTARPPRHAHRRRL